MHLDECRLWTKWRNKRQGHGRLQINRKKWLIHRLAWLQYNGDIPTNKMVLHKCNVPNCYNINHLYLGDRSQNTKDSVRAGTHNMARKEACPKGHPYDSVNTYVYTRKNGGINRACRFCRAASTKQYFAKKRGAKS